MPTASKESGRTAQTRNSMETASQRTNMSKDSTLRNTLRRWKDRWRTSVVTPGSSRASSPPLSRYPSNTSSATPYAEKTSQSTPTSAPSPKSESLPSIPASPPPAPAALFAPTTETFIHSPADPRNRSRNTSTSSISPPPMPATLRKPPPLSRRNTAPTEFLTSALPTEHELPMNVVTTTIVAGNGYGASAEYKRKRTSRLRLSISRRGSILASSPSSPQLHSQFERSNSRSASRLEERSVSRATGRFEAVPERGGHGEDRERVDSDRETLFEESEGIKRRPRALGAEDKETVELAYQYVGSRDGEKKVKV